jgi:hypothetical protein
MYHRIQQAQNDENIERAHTVDLELRDAAGVFVISLLTGSKLICINVRSCFTTFNNKRILNIVLLDDKSAERTAYASAFCFAVRSHMRPASSS